MTKILVIDPEHKTVTLQELLKSEDIREIIGGYIQLAYVWPDSGDVLYVDEEGLKKPNMFFFRFALRADDFPLAGKGVITGRDKYDAKGEYCGLEDVKISAAEVLELCDFLSREQVDAWGKANASEPAVTLTMFESGRVEQHVLSRYGELIANIPRPEKK